MKPEPTPRGRSSSCCGRFGRGPWRGVPGAGWPKKRRKNSCISSSISPLPPPRCATFSTVRMLTTDGPTWSTRSVKSGSVRVCACTDSTGRKVAPAVSASAKASRPERSLCPSTLNIIGCLSKRTELQITTEAMSTRRRLGSARTPARRQRIARQRVRARLWAKALSVCCGTSPTAVSHQSLAGAGSRRRIALVAPMVSTPSPGVRVGS
ncbi:hypothetical protein D3C72_1710480 [compost metagenome]